MKYGGDPKHRKLEEERMAEKKRKEEAKKLEEEKKALFRPVATQKVTHGERNGLNFHVTEVLHQLQLQA